MAARPYWMENGRIAETGVPEKLAHGRFITSRDRLRMGNKIQQRKMLQEQLKRLRPHQLSSAQRNAGARLIA